MIGTTTGHLLVIQRFTVFHPCGAWFRVLKVAFLAGLSITTLFGLLKPSLVVIQGSEPKDSAYVV